MNRILNVSELEQLLAKKKHDVGQVIDVVPFVTKRKKAIRDNFNEILGELSRRICGLGLRDSKKGEIDLTLSEHPIIEQIIQQVECGDDEAFDLKRFLEQFLFNNNQIKPIHPYLFNYVPISDMKHEGELKKYAQYVKDILIEGEEGVKAVFQNRETEDILTELILGKIDALEKKNYVMQFQPVLTNFSILYREDLQYISQHRDYFLSSFSLLTHFYAFMNVLQLLIKFESALRGEFHMFRPLYFALEWESINARRKAVDGIEGYKWVKENAPNLFVHIHTISQLSHNSINAQNESSGKLAFMPYDDLIARIDEAGNEVSMQFLEDLKEWIERYREIFNLEKVKEPNNILEGIQILFGYLKQGTNTQACEKFGLNIEDLGANVFLRARGSLGQVLNMNHEMLLLLTAVSIKDKRMPLNKLFEEFEKRGVAFDRYSKKEIISLYDSLNILDKKSDSGDAQYVKPIL